MTGHPLFQGNAKIRKRLADFSDLGMVRVEAVLPDGERPFIQCDGLGGLPAALQERGKTDKGRRHVGMVRPERPFLDDLRPFEVQLRVIVPADLQPEIRERGTACIH